MRARLEELFPYHPTDDDYLGRIMQQALAPIQQQLREIAARTVPNLQLPTAITQAHLPELSALHPHMEIPLALRETLEAQAEATAQALSDALPTTGTGGANWLREERIKTRDTEDRSGEDDDQYDDA